jgi:hypothetical protein
MFVFLVKISDMPDINVPFDFDDSQAIAKLRNINQGLQGVDTNAKTARQSMQEAFAGSAKVIESNTVALDKAEAQIGATISATQSYSTEQKKLNSDMLLGNTVIGQTVSNLKQKVSSLQGVVGGLKGAASGAKALRVALISTGIGAIVVALGSLVVFLTKTQRGMDFLAKVSTVAGVIMERISSIFEKFGGVVFDTFTSVEGFKAALKGLGDFIIGQVVNRFNGLINLMKSVGAAISALARGDMEGLKNASVDAALSIGAINTGFSESQIKNFASDVVGLGKELSQAAKEAAALADEIAGITRAKILFNAEEAALSRTIEEQKEIMSDSTKSFNERQKALNAARLAEEQRNKKQLDFAKKDLELLDRKLKASGKDLENLDNAELEERINLQVEISKLEAQSDRTKKSLNKSERGLRNEASAAYKEQQAALKKIREEYDGILKTLNDATQQAKLDGLFGVDKLNEEAKIAVKVIDDLENQLRAAAIKAKQPFTEGDQFNALRIQIEEKRISEVAKLEEKAALDAIEREKIKTNMLAEILSVSVDERFNLEESGELLKIEAERKALEDRIKVKEDYRDKIADADKAAIDAEIEQLNLALQKQDSDRQKVEKASLDRRIEEKIKNIDQQQQIDSQYVQFIKESADETLTIEQFRQKRLLEIEADALNQRIALLEQKYGPNSDEVKFARQQAEIIAGEIANVGKDLDNPFSSIKQFLKDALQIDDAQLQAITEAVGSIASNIGSIISGNTDAAIAENDRLLESIRERIGETEELLDEEIEKQKNGYANNVESKTRELEELKALEAQAEAERKELEQDKLKQQLASDLLAQGSSIATGIAGILATSGSLGPIAGPILAAAAIISFLAIFKKYKAASKAAASEKAYKGGSLADYLHGERDSGFVSRNGQSDIPGRGKGMRVEGTNLVLGAKEFVVSEGPAQKYQHLLEAINADKLQAPTFAPVSTQRHLTESGKIIVRRESVRNSQNNESLEKAMEKIMDKHADKMIGYMKNKRQIAVGKGFRIEYTDNRIKIIRY